jgi:hypothetical protein
MRALFQRQPLIGALVIAAALLVAAIGMETGFGTRLAPAIPAAPSKPAKPFEARLLPPLDPPNPDQAYPEMVARPLFVPQRRPAPAAEAAAKSTMKRGQFVLQGVTTAGDTRIALLKEKATGHIVRVEKGHEVNGMKLAEVSPESVTLVQGAEKEVLPLEVVKPGPAHAAPAGPIGATTQGGMFGGGGANPAVRPPGLQPAPPAGNASPGHPANPEPPALPQATAAPLTPEELLARRRALRNRQNH